MITGSLPGVNRGCPLVSGETPCICPPSGVGFVLTTLWDQTLSLFPSSKWRPAKECHLSQSIVHMGLMPVQLRVGSGPQRPRTTDGGEKKEPLLCKWASHLPLPAPPPSHPMSSHDSLQLAGLGATHAPPVPCLLAPLTCHPNPPAVSHLCQGAGWGGTRVENWGKGGCSEWEEILCLLISLEKGTGNESHLQRLATNVTSTCPVRPAAPSFQVLSPWSHNRGGD